MSLFDGMAGLLNDTFGGSVTYLKAGATLERTVQSVFRTEPVEVLEDGANRAVLLEMPTWSVPEHLAYGMGRGDHIRPGDGKRYRVLSRHRGRSPASDRFIVFALEEAGL